MKHWPKHDISYPALVRFLDFCLRVQRMNEKCGFHALILTN
jgi:hypothetical protein